VNNKGINTSQKNKENKREMATLFSHCNLYISLEKSQKHGGDRYGYWPSVFSSRLLLPLFNNTNGLLQ
jgi:hypothetical protein